VEVIAMIIITMKLPDTILTIQLIGISSTEMIALGWWLKTCPMILIGALLKII